MSPHIICPKCNQEITYKVDSNIQKVRCPSCSSIFLHPVHNKKTGNNLPVAKTIQKAQNPQVDADDEEVILVKEDIYCPKCQNEMQPNAIICISCGYNRQTGKQLKTKVGRIDRTIKGMNISFRIISLAAMIGVGLLITMLAAREAKLGALIFLGIWCLIAALLAGSTTTIRAHRDESGGMILRIIHWIMFMPREAEEIDLKDYDTILYDYIVGMTQPEKTWHFIIIVFGLFMGLVPGIIYLFWLMQESRRERYTLQLCRAGARSKKNPIFFGTPEFLREFGNSLKQVAPHLKHDRA